MERQWESVEGQCFTRVSPHPCQASRLRKLSVAVVQSLSPPSFPSLSTLGIGAFKGMGLPVPTVFSNLEMSLSISKPKSYSVATEPGELAVSSGFPRSCLCCLGNLLWFAMPLPTPTPTVYINAPASAFLETSRSSVAVLLYWPEFVICWVKESIRKLPAAF